MLSPDDVLRMIKFHRRSNFIFRFIRKQDTKNLSFPCNLSVLDEGLKKQEKVSWRENAVYPLLILKFKPLSLKVYYSPKTTSRHHDLRAGNIVHCLTNSWKERKIVEEGESSQELRWLILSRVYSESILREKVVRVLFNDVLSVTQKRNRYKTRIRNTRQHWCINDAWDRHQEITTWKVVTQTYEGCDSRSHSRSRTAKWRTRLTYNSYCLTQVYFETWI